MFARLSGQRGGQGFWQAPSWKVKLYKARLVTSGPRSEHAFPASPCKTPGYVQSAICKTLLILFGVAQENGQTLGNGRFGRALPSRRFWRRMSSHFPLFPCKIATPDLYCTLQSLNGSRGNRAREPVTRKTDLTDGLARNEPQPRSFERKEKHHVEKK